MLDFTALAKWSTSRAPLLKGLLPSLSTFLTLTLVSFAVTLGLSLWAGTGAALLGLAPLWAKTFASIAGAALITFWFNRDIKTAVLNSRENRKHFAVNEHVPVELKQLVKHIRTELNAHFKVDYPSPRICLITSSQTRIDSALGRSPAKSALFFPSAMFDSHNTRWNNRDIAALVAHEMAKIYLHRGWSGTIVAIAKSFIDTLDYLQQSENWWLKAVGKLLQPVQLLLLLHRAVERSYAYEAASVVMQIGRGLDYFKAIDTNVFPALVKQPAPSYLNYNAAHKKRSPYQGNRYIKMIADWIDNLVWVEDKSDKKEPRIISLLDAVVREGRFYWQELNSSGPRTTRMKDYLRDELFIGKLPWSTLLTNTETTAAEMLNYLTENGPREGLTYLDKKSFEQFVEKLAKQLDLRINETENLMNMPWRQMFKQDFDAIVQLFSQEELETIDRRDRKKNALSWDQRDLAVPTTPRHFYKQIGFGGEGFETSLTGAEPRDVKILCNKITNLSSTVTFLQARNQEQQEQIENLVQQVQQLSHPRTTRNTRNNR